MRLNVHLRNNTSESVEGFFFQLPVTRVWWESVSYDMHIQFTGFEGCNIKPDDNAYEGEMLIPKAAKVFRKWLESEGVKTRGKKLTIFSSSLEEGKARNKYMPPVTAYEDLINNWVSPNRSKPKSIC